MHAPIGGLGPRTEDFALWTVIAVALVVRFSTQGAINRLLAAEKSRTLRDLRERLDREHRCAEATHEEVVRSLHRVQILLHDLWSVEDFSPSPVDTRFVVQILLSVIATLIANVLLRTVVAKLLDP